MAQQQWPGDEAEADVPAWSQGSTVSNASTMSVGANKRRFEDEEVQEDVRALVVAGRAIAVPRRVKRGGEKIVGVVGQENLGDFEDAEFLDYGLVGEGDEEMGGV